MYKIMIVEDDSALTKALQKIISSWDDEVRCVKRFEAVTEE